MIPSGQPSTHHSDPPHLQQPIWTLGVDIGRGHALASQVLGLLYTQRVDGLVVAYAPRKTCVASLLVIGECLLWRTVVYRGRAECGVRLVKFM